MPIRRILRMAGTLGHWGGDVRVRMLTDCDDPMHRWCASVGGQGQTSLECVYADAPETALVALEAAVEKRARAAADKLRHDFEVFEEAMRPEDYQRTTDSGGEAK